MSGTQNDFLVWAGGTNANVLGQAAYAALGIETSGVISGKASAQQANKTWRQTSIMAAMIAKFIVDRVNRPVIDDGTVNTIEANFELAIQSLFSIPNTGVVPGTYGPTVTLAVEADGRITSLQNAGLTSVGVAAGTYVGATISVTSTGLVASASSVAYGPLASPNQWLATNTFQQGAVVTGYDSGGIQLRATLDPSLGFGAGLRMDNTNAYLVSTPANSPLGTFNALRPYTWNLTSGAVTIDGTAAGVTIGGITHIRQSLNVDGSATIGTTLTAGDSISAPNAIHAGGALSGGILSISGGGTVGGGFAVDENITAGTSIAAGTVVTANNFSINVAGGNLLTHDTVGTQHPLIGGGTDNVTNIFSGTTGIIRAVRFDNGVIDWVTDSNGNFVVTGNSVGHGLVTEPDSSGFARVSFKDASGNLIGLISQTIGGVNQASWAVAPFNSTAIDLDSTNGTVLTGAANKLTVNGTLGTFSTLFTATAVAGTNQSGWNYTGAGAGASSGPFNYNIYAGAGASMLATTFFATSDKRLKTEIETISPKEGERFVKTSRPVTFLKNEREPGAGFIAQEQILAGYSQYIAVMPHEGLPELVEEDLTSLPDVAMSVSYDNYIAYLTAALQSALGRIEALENQKG